MIFITTSFALYFLLNVIVVTTTIEAFTVDVVSGGRTPYINSFQSPTTTSINSGSSTIPLSMVATAATIPTPRNTATTRTTPSITVEEVSDDEVIGTRPRIVSIESAEDYKAFLEGDSDDEERLCIVKFHASWCKSCQKFGEQYKRIAREIGDLEEVTSSCDDEESSIVRDGELRMGEIEYGSNTELCKSLGVTKLPAVHIYSSKGKLVDSFKCGPKKLPMLLNKLDMYMSMSPAEIDFEADMYEGAILGDTVLEALNEEILSHGSNLIGSS